MTKTLKKLLCVLMALAMLLGFAACDDKEDAPKEKTTSSQSTDNPAEPADDKNSEDAVLAAVDDYFDEMIADLTSDEMIEWGATALANKFEEEDTADEYLDLYKPIAEKILKYQADSIDIDDVKIVDEKDGMYEVSYTITAIDFDLDGLDEDAIEQEVMQSFQADLLEKQANGELDGMTEDEIMSYGIEFATNLLWEKLEAELKSSDTSTETFTLYVEEKDGEWVVEEA